MNTLLTFISSISLSSIFGFVISALAFTFTIILSIRSVFSINSALNKTIEDRVNKIVEHPDYVYKIASLVRPTVIFNDDGSIIHDLGGMIWISEIKIEKAGKPEWTDGLLLPRTITITPTKHLRNAPIITCVDLSGFEITTSRGSRFNWIYTLEPVSVFIPEKPEDQAHEIIFRMEIVP